MSKLTDEEKSNLEEKTFGDIVFMIIEPQLKTSRLYRFEITHNAKDTNCPAKALVESPKFKWGIVQEI